MERLHTFSQAVLRADTCSTSTGRKQDAWFVVDPESAETQMTLTSEALSTPLLYIGRTCELGPCSGQPPLLLCPGLAIVLQVELGQSVHLSANKHSTEH